MPLGTTYQNALAANIMATDWALQALATATIWGLQPNTAVNIYRAGRWPRMDGNRYSNQPSVGLGAQ